MKDAEKMLRSWISYDEYSNVPHVIYFSDFNTNNPSSNRIDRIASEISECVKRKHKNNEAKRGD